MSSPAGRLGEQNRQLLVCSARPSPLIVAYTMTIRSHLMREICDHHLVFVVSVFLGRFKQHRVTRVIKSITNTPPRNARYTRTNLQLVIM